ncbi:MAG TPA: BON domain-containing protein [Candidatus Acidoferrum sp.]|jgi:osmotically-inducible protein OsmY|nr:BON domain-containing protein [Candidatus Acidoferrum sp.]
MNLSKKLGFEALVLGTCLLLGSSLPATGIRTPTQDPQQPAADNTKNNKGDQSSGAMTADRQKMNPADRDLTKKIRTSLHGDSTLSTYAHNIKIISQDGKVTLKGPVRSDDEKSAIEAKATEIAGQGNVTNQLTVAPPKS